MIKIKKGFTLIELIIVVFIIGLLGTIVTISISGAKSKSRDLKRISEITQLQVALDNYNKAEGRYPELLFPGESLIGSSTGIVFMSRIPQNFSYYDMDCYVDGYEYSYDSVNNDYKIAFCLENKVDNYVVGNKCAIPGKILEGKCFFCENYVSDIDGNIYNTVSIEDQCWIAENLKVTKYNDGSDIFYPGADISSWINNTDGAYACWENILENCDSKGSFYNWYAVDNLKGLCPEGWHVPSHNETTQLERNLCLLSGNSIEICEDFFPEDEVSEGLFGVDEGKKLKSISWGGLDTYGFNIIPTGYRHDNGNYYSSGIDWAFLYTSTEADLTSWRRIFGPDYDNIQRIKNAPKTRGCSVRCLKNSE